MSHHTPIPIRRFKQVYVEIPPSPFHSSRINELSSPAHVQPFASGNLKENTPLHPTHGTMTQQIAAAASHKRKLSDRDISTPMIMPNTKKPKLATSSGANTADNRKLAKTSATVGIIPTANASTDYPNGFIYCHQCGKKRDTEASIQCTLRDSHTVKDKVTKERRCHNKFCKSCLKNRYGEDVDAIKTKASTSSKEKGHVDGEGYTFTCPKCRDICNCARCRKAKGLEPTGNLTNAVRKAGAGSAAEVLVSDPKVAGVLPGKGVQTVPPEQKKPKAKHKTVSTDIVVNHHPKVKFTSTKKSKSTSKPLPTLKWSRLRVNLSLGEAEARFQIREFVLRFAPVMDPVIAKTHLEELEDIGGRGRACDEDEEMVGWVSEACVKSIVVGLLGLLANDEDGDLKKALKTAVKEIRACGANLNKIWAILSTLRDSLDGSGSESSDTSGSSDSEMILTFPDPLPPPASVAVYNTRNTRSSKVTGNAGTPVYVVNSAQMVPVLVALTDAALETEDVREEIESGVKDGREKVREARECGKKENERWEKEKKDTEGTMKDKEKEKEAKDKRDLHKQHMQDVNNALKIAMYTYAPRFGPLGSDNEGRIYWALSPGVAERDCASEFIASMAEESGDGKGNEKKSKKGHGKRKRRVRGDEERSLMKEWSWFVGVWGKRPAVKPGEAIVRAHENKSKGDDDDSDTSESSDEGDEDVEKWWGFWEPEEIRKVAEWIEIKSGLDQDDQTSEGSGASSPTSEMIGRGAHKDRVTSSVRGEDGWDSHGDITMANTGSPSKMELKALVKGLNEYAAVLEWRVKKEENVSGDGQDEKDDDGDDVVGSKSKGRGKATTVIAAGKFYK